LEILRKLIPAKDMSTTTLLLNVLHAAVVAENAQLAAELDIARVALRKEQEMRAVSESLLVSMLTISENKLPE
jgi:hypothetical protein